MEKTFWVYILSSAKNGTLYVGMTSNLIKRVWEHRNNETKSFVGKYKVFNLVYFEQHITSEDAALRERQIKKWNQAWKIDLIQSQNPEWQDRYEEFAQS